MNHYLTKPTPNNHFILFLTTLLILSSKLVSADASDPLPAWNDTASKASIIKFVNEATQIGAPSFVPIHERIAVFDNDGTLWSEQPFYFQLAFILDQIKAIAPEHPDWQTQEPFKSVLAGDMKTVMAGGEKSLLELLMATHAGMTTDEFAQSVKDWIATAKHPKYNRLYTDLVYQPMLELLAYLKAKGFKIYIVSGGGIEFMRPWAEKIYGIPPQNIIGSSIKTQFEMRDGKPVLIRLPEIDFINDKAGKPVGINQFIGRRPIAAFGNSDGDLEMLQWVTTEAGTRFGLLVHHTDAERETAYDRESSIGRLDKALNEAAQHGWTVVDMKTDWKQVFPHEKR